LSSTRFGRSENNQAATSDQKRYAHMILYCRVGTRRNEEGEVPSPVLV